MCSCHSSLVQDHLIVPIPFLIVYFRLYLILHYKLWYLSCQWTCLNLRNFDHWKSYQLWMHVPYPILWNCAEKYGSIFGVAFGRIISCLPTRLTSCFYIFVLQNQLLSRLSLLSWILVSRRSYVRTHHQILLLSTSQMRYEYRIHLEVYLLITTIQMYQV